MAFGLLPLEKRLKDNIRNYSLTQLFDVASISDYIESIYKVTGVSLLLTDRHGEKIVCLGDFVGFVPDTVNEPGRKIRVHDRTIGHLYVKDEQLADANHKRLIDDVIVRLSTEVAKSYESLEIANYADDLAKLLEKEQYQVKHGETEDALTGVLNSTHFDKKCKSVNQSEIVPVGVVCANINDWKYVNDKYGDEESDRLIEVVANILKKEGKPEYIIGRCGGDFFNVLIPGAMDGEVEDYIKRVQAACDGFEDAHLAPSVACGSVLKSNVEQSLNDLLSDAEYEMFNNKFELKNAPGYRARLEKR